MFPLRQSTASQEILLGPFLDDTDQKTAEIALTIANTDIKIWKNGGTTEVSKTSGGATHIAAGRYFAVLDATDTDTLGMLEINVHVAGALPVKVQRIVYPPMVYDSLILGTDFLHVDAREMLAGLINAAAFTQGAADKVWLSTAGGRALTATGVQGIWDALMSALTTSGSVGKLLADNLNATVLSRASQSTLDAEAVLIKAHTDTIPLSPDIATSFAGINVKLNTIDDFLDTEIAAIPTAAANAAAIWALVIEGAHTAKDYMRLMAAAAFGKVSGAATTTVTIRDRADTKNRITATVDADGNRSSVVVDAG